MYDFVLQMLSLAQYSDFKQDSHGSLQWDNVAEFPKEKLSKS